MPVLTPSSLSKLFPFQPFSLHLHLYSNSTMIALDDFYNVMCAVVPLYVAMILAYAAVKWWRLFTPAQCSGINRFVATFAVPVLSFHFISSNNPYQMDSRFIIADTLSKLLLLLLLSLWAFLTCGRRHRRRRRLDWVITLFSVGSLPNTLVMGIPLLRSMYGEFTQGLMVQIVVLQCIIWYTLLLFLFEYRAAILLIERQFPGDSAAAIAKFEVDGDVISLDGGEAIQADSEVEADGRLRVRIRRSASSSTGPGSAISSTIDITPRRLSGISGAEIYSVSTPIRGYRMDQTHLPPPPEQLTVRDVAFGIWSTSSPALSGYASSDAYSLQPTPRASNFNETESIGTPVWKSTTPPPAADGTRLVRQPSPPVGGGMKLFWGEMKGRGEGGGRQEDKDVGGARTFVQFRPLDRGGGLHIALAPPKPMIWACGYKHMPIQVSSSSSSSWERDLSFRSTSRFVLRNQEEDEDDEQEMPEAFVMLKLILRMVGGKLSRNPNTYSSLFGLLWSLISFKWEINMPKLMMESINIISDAGLGMAMFSLGLFMALQPKIIACGAQKAAVSMAIRFIGGPMMISAASIAVGLRGRKLHTAIVQAALPQGIVPFVFAREYGLHADILSTGVIFGMLVSLPVTLLYYILLGL